MNETQIIQGVRKMLDACFAAGLIKTLEEAQYAVAMYQSLVTKLSPIGQPIPPYVPPVPPPIKKENDNQ